MLSIGLVLTLVSLAAAVEVPGFFNHTQCVFVPTTHTFTCSYGERRVECSAVANFTNTDVNYHLFGIERVNSTFFNLFPRPFDNGTYIGGFGFGLYTGEPFHYGIRVVQSSCFAQIVDLFSVITDYRTVTVGGVLSPVSLIGEILYSDSTVQKRWLWGYGFGLGYPYYGWGGLYGGLYGYYPGYWWGK